MLGGDVDDRSGGLPPIRYAGFLQVPREQAHVAISGSARSGQSLVPAPRTSWHRAARHRRGVLALCFGVLLLSGCAAPDEPVSTSKPKQVNEEEQGYRSAERTIADHCEPTRRRGGARGPSRAASLHAVSRIIRYVIRHNKDDYDMVIDNRRALADLAGYLEEQGCLRDQIEHIDRVLRVLPVPDVPDDYFIDENDYLGDEQPDYGR